jgi:hypothetical protein
MSKDLLETINLDQVKALLEIALKVRDKFGDRGHWFSNFDRAIDGIKARIFGLKIHYNGLQSIHNEDNSDHRIPNFIELDHHLADILFNLDSSIECFAFALNAFGYGIIDTNDFISIEDARKLRQIKPDNIFAEKNNAHYKKYFPNLMNYWLETPRHRNHVTPKQLWESIKDNHDVSKHRFRLCHMVSGSDNETDIHLDQYPKKPLIEEVEFEEFYPWTLIDHLKEFVPFLNKSVNLVIQDIEEFIRQSN